VPNFIYLLISMRGKVAPKRKIQPDAVYNSEVVTKLINYIMQDGKKTTAKKIVYQALEELGKKTKSDPLVALEKALENVKPKIEVRSRRVGGANYQVPMPVRGDRQLALTLRWIIGTARGNRGGEDFWNALARELIAAHNGEGAAVRKKEEIQRMAEANRAFAHFAWT